MLKDDWKGRGWYTTRIWVHTNGRYTVEDWDSPEQPEAFWYEDEEELAECYTCDPECETYVDYYGDGEFPNAPVSVAPFYLDFDYAKWQTALNYKANGAEWKDTLEQNPCW